MVEISRDLLVAEIRSAREILVKWEELLVDQVPHLDIPGTEESLERFFMGLVNELSFTSGKLDNIVAVLRQ